MCGFRIYSVLKQPRSCVNKETSDIPIIFVTASIIPAIEGIMQEAKSITNSAFMGKPINTRTFAKEISQYLK
jgi:two-component system cell cycle response regulator DivK